MRFNCFVFCKNRHAENSNTENRHKRTNDFFHDLAVYRLQENGFIEEAEKRIEDGRARIYLGITSSGQCYYDQLRTEYKLFTATLETLMNMDGHLYAEGKNG